MHRPASSDYEHVASTHGGDDVVHAEPFGAIELELARWWIPLPDAR